MKVFIATTFIILSCVASAATDSSFAEIDKCTTIIVGKTAGNCHL